MCLRHVLPLFFVVLHVASVNGGIINEPINHTFETNDQALSACEMLVAALDDCEPTPIQFDKGSLGDQSSATPDPRSGVIAPAALLPAARVSANEQCCIVLLLDDLPPASPEINELLKPPESHG